MTWLYDDYRTSEDLVSKLYYAKNSGVYDKTPVLIGLTELNGRTNNFVISHEWSSKNSLLNDLKKELVAVKEGFKELSNLGNDVHSTITGNDVTTSEFSNQRAIGKFELVKQFKGSGVNFNIPKFTFFAINDSMKNLNNVRNTVLSLTGTFSKVVEPNLNFKKNGIEKNSTLQLGGNIGNADGSVGNVAFYQTPPSNYKFTYLSNVDTILQGTFKMKNSRFTLDNLVVNNVNVEYSDSVISNNDKTYPAYAKITLEFTFAKTPTQLDLLRYIR